MPLLSRSLRSLPLLAPPFLPLALRHADGFSLMLHRPFPLSHSLPPGFSPSPPLATFSVGPDRDLMRTSFSADVLPPPPFSVLLLLHLRFFVLLLVSFIFMQW